ncbi:hypothetical protein HY449_01940 [Candidatus Pacearchaeota archaeon]|nr:hypothetical protein [Candidatus Pacearchaeota archaeon]
MKKEIYNRLKSLSVPRGYGIVKKIQKTEEELRKILAKDQYEILKGKGAEKPFTGKSLYSKKKGVYSPQYPVLLAQG